MEKLNADYLVIGSGAMGMAFTDVLLTETDATVIIVDRYHQPGGHWTTAYPYVRLHQPSAFYGVNSRALGSDRIDTAGWNKGLYELATAHEVCAYFDQVMQHQFLPTGRVQYLPSSDYLGNGEIRGLFSGETLTASVARTVDATYMNVTVPSMRKPPFPVAEGIACEPPNGLPRAAGQFDEYVIVGAGKTGMDACLFLLKSGVAPEAIRWIMPRDSWLLDRARIQPDAGLGPTLAEGFAQQMKAIAEADSVESLLTNVAEVGQLIRFSEDVWPTMYRCATVTQAELEQLRRIEGLIRLGRVQRIEADQIVLEEGSVPTGPRTLHVDCAADGLERRPAVPVFAGDKITLQAVRTCQQVFSAAFIAHVEANYPDEAVKNELTTPVPHPDSEVDFLRTSLANSLNAARWAQDPELQAWLQAARLDGFTRDLPEEDATRIQALVNEHGMASVVKLTELLAEIDQVTDAS